jgi:hypothetical protein
VAFDFLDSLALANSTMRRCRLFDVDSEPCDFFLLTGITSLSDFTIIAAAVQINRIHPVVSCLGPPTESARGLDGY